MTRRDKELEQALAGFERTGDEELGALVDTADDLTSRFAAPTPDRPEGRAMFIEGVAARKRSFASSLTVPGFAVIILLLSIAIMGRSALPGESLYPVRNVLRSAGLAEAPDRNIRREIDDAVLLIGRARAVSERSPSIAGRLAVSALMSLGRAEGYLGQVGADDRVMFEARIDSLRTRAIALIRRSIDDESSGSGSGSDDSGGDDSSGSGSDDDSSTDDSSGSGSDDSGGDDSSGSGSDDSITDDSSGSGSDDSGGDDSSGSGSDDSITDHSSGSGSDDSAEADD